MWNKIKNLFTKKETYIKYYIKNDEVNVDIRNDGNLEELLLFVFKDNHDILISFLEQTLTEEDLNAFLKKVVTRDSNQVLVKPSEYSLWK